MASTFNYKNVAGYITPTFSFDYSTTNFLVPKKFDPPFFFFKFLLLLLPPRRGGGGGGRPVCRSCFFVIIKAWVRACWCASAVSVCICFFSWKTFLFLFFFFISSRSKSISNWTTIVPAITNSPFFLNKIKRERARFYFLNVFLEASAVCCVHSSSP